MIYVFLKDIRMRLDKILSIFFSILLMALLTYVALDVQNQIVKALVDNKTATYKQVDGVLTSKDSYETLDYSLIKDDEFEKISPMFATNGYIYHDDLHVVANVYGVDFEMTEKFGNEKFTTELKDNKKFCYMSSSNADKYGYQIGDKVLIHIQEQEIECTLVGFGEDGLFLEDTKPVFFIDKDVLQKMYQCDKNQYTTALVKLKENEDFEEFAEKINTSSKYKYKISQVCDIETIKSETANLVMPVQLITILAVIIGIMIIFSNYKIVLLERQRFFGTLKILGLSMKGIRKYLMRELILVSVCASALGIGLGCFVSGGLSSLFYEGNSEINMFCFDLQNVIITLGLLFIVVISLLFVSCKNLTKATTKELIFSDVKSSEKHSYVKDVVFFILFVIGLVLGQQDDSNMVILSVVVMIVSGLQLVPILFKLFTWIIKSISYRVSWKDFFIASKELWGLKIYHLNVIIGVLSIVVIMSVCGLSDALSSLLGEAYDTFSTDVFIEDISPDNYPTVKRYVEKNDNVKDFYEYLTASGTVDKTLQISSVQGIDNETFHNFNEFYDIDSSDYDKIDDGKSILLTAGALEKLDKQIGDKVSLEINNIKEEYTILGQFDPNGDAMGSVAIISEDNMKEDFFVTVPRFLCVKLNDTSDEAVTKIRNGLSDSIVTVLTKSEKQGQQQNLVDVVIMVIDILSYIVILVGVIGMFGNLYIAEMQKHKVNATYTTLGVAKNQQKLIDLSQIIIFCLGSGLIACGFVKILLVYLNKILLLLDLKYNLIFSYKMFLVAMAEIFVLLVVTKFIIQRKFKNTSIIEILKCE